MNNHRSALILLFFQLLLLSACGGKDAEALQAENEKLQIQISALEEENAALRAELERVSTKTWEKDGDSREENPIDLFYNAAETDGSTVSMNLVAGSWADAWEAETRNLAGQLKSQLPLAEDRNLVDSYLAAAEEQIQRMNVMAVYPVSDVNIPQENRLASSGTLRGVLWAGQRNAIWRDTFYQLRWILPFTQDYTFLFDSEAARLELSEWAADS